MQILICHNIISLILNILNELINNTGPSAIIYKILYISLCLLNQLIEHIPLVQFNYSWLLYIHNEGYPILKKYTFIL